MGDNDGIMQSNNTSPPSDGTSLSAKRQSCPVRQLRPIKPRLRKPETHIIPSKGPSHIITMKKLSSTTASTSNITPIGESEMLHLVADPQVITLLPSSSNPTDGYYRSGPKVRRFIRVSLTLVNYTFGGITDSF